MQQRIVSRLKSVTLGEPQNHRNIVIFPVTGGEEGAINYLTMAEALEGRLLTVAEVSRGGSVPELKVTNTADRPVLLLDGEELAGAKQNRVLNTTVLVPAKQSIVIPVSCTEHGRWAYSTQTFHESGNVMSRAIRARKSRSVSDSLEADASFRSNQGEVWDEISHLQASMNIHSDTGAMRDVYESQRESLDDALRAFPPVPGQAGILAVINGEAAGFDIISSPAAFARLHGKLIRSYVMDALANRTKNNHGPQDALEVAKAFLERAVGCEEKTFKSVGCGDDYRFKGEHIAGSALLHNDTVIHVAFFHLDQAHVDGRMAGLNRRRTHYMYD